MKFIFKPYYFAIFYLLLLIEIAIAVLLKGGFIRHTFGDFLAVILMYCFIKSFIEIKPVIVALVVLIIAFGIEFLQRYNILEVFNLQDNKFAATVFGTSFSYQDLLAYSLGTIFSLIIDLLISKNNIKYELN